ncbi:MAG TPA: hypothetical protein PKW57_03800 [Anaerolineaceae bacterium]|nr:hypothetical protein [Anaerolineaceae bacterium]HPS32604.1 hypothetical protein [Anaerolineaceae bacterium]
MGKFLESEKIEQIAWKATSPTISEQARGEGFFRGKFRPFCLPQQYAEENLFPPIREEALEFFREKRISWHQGSAGKPSSHLCDSQVCGVNFLFPFANRPDELARLLKPIFPNIQRMLPVEDKRYVSFEWIGEENYLEERVQRDGVRTRGANFTSLDAIVMFEDVNCKRQVVLIEWKYTESYSGNYLGIADSGTDRRQIYQHLFDNPACVVDLNKLPDLDSLYYEPFYQFMRQQFLAAKMEEARELGADHVRLLHIAPRINLDFTKITSPKLIGLGKSATEVWGNLVRVGENFISVKTEDLFLNFASAEMEDWNAYIRTRYRWVAHKE